MECKLQRMLGRFNWSSMSALVGLVDKLKLLSKPDGGRQQAFCTCIKAFKSESHSEAHSAFFFYTGSH